MASNSYVNTYSGNNGDSYNDLENENKGLFTLESSSYSSNGTGTYSGHFPELFYYLS